MSSPKRVMTTAAAAAMDASAASPQPSSKRMKISVSPSTFAESDNDNGDRTARLYLLKSEPDEFSVQHLRDVSPDGTAPWDGVRNAQARNILREMRVGDRAFFYHSSCKVPAIVGIVRVVREAYPARGKNPGLGRREKGGGGRVASGEICRDGSRGARGGRGFLKVYIVTINTTSHKFPNTFV